MKRRTFLVVLGASTTLVPVRGLTQTPPKRPLIGLLAAGSKAAGERYYSRFQEGMREFGYAEGRDFAFESRYAEGDFDVCRCLQKNWFGSSPM
jgi:putative tryptophan/tyrosine transport system substrate-binding protein